MNFETLPRNHKFLKATIFFSLLIHLITLIISPFFGNFLFKFLSNNNNDDDDDDHNNNNNNNNNI